jgi:hypothetical protein
MTHDRASDRRFPVKLTVAQRKLLAELAPNLAGRLRLDEPYQRVVEFSLAEMQAILAKAGGLEASGGRRNTLRHLVQVTSGAIDRAGDAQQVYQFKVTLLDTHPPIWRRFQVKDCTLDDLHGHIQTAMGWTNSHLHDFKIKGKSYGDPMLLQENFDEYDYGDSTETKLSDVLPKGGRRFRFEYQYDFGDSWQHEVLFEGLVPADPRGRYPLCLEGARACPPEDVGGVWGYQDFVEAMADRRHERHRELREWFGRRRFDPEAFDPAAATREMRRGLPDWRRLV